MLKSTGNQRRFGQFTEPTVTEKKVSVLYIHVNYFNVNSHREIFADTIVSTTFHLIKNKTDKNVNLYIFC